MANTHSTDTQTTSTDRDTNADPISGEPGAHPVGVGVGAAGGGATGAMIGTMIAGPIGTAVGAVIGAVAGGLAGKGVAEAVDPTAEDAYWRENHGRQPYASTSDHTYDDLAPAYRTGYEKRSEFERGTKFEDAEPVLRKHYEESYAGGVGSTTVAPHMSTRTHDTPVGKAADAAGDAAGKVAGKAKVGWEHAKHATRAAWDRLDGDTATPGTHHVGSSTHGTTRVDERRSV